MPTRRSFLKASAIADAGLHSPKARPICVQPWVKFATKPKDRWLQYVWRCHILEHEKHDMMRNLVANP